MEYAFTPTILRILKEEVGDAADEVFRLSELLQYINRKTKSASSGSKSRGAFANHYAIYVLVEDYVRNGYHQSGNYKDYGGAQFAQLFGRQRELPFGAKLQNHALDSRLNEEFKKFFPETSYTPIIRNLVTNRYWINENLLIIRTPGSVFNIAEVTLKIIDAYVEAKKDAFENFIKDCVKIQQLQEESPGAHSAFIQSLLRPNVDARIFEIVSYSVLKEFYKEQRIFWGWSLDSISPENLLLYKTGRTNANDGGIDFVMRPLGRFFQVTETLDVKKYFLDIDKIQHFPLTFVVKSELPPDRILSAIKTQAQDHFVVNTVVEVYMAAIEEIINIPSLLEMLSVVIGRKAISEVLNEIVLQSKLEFNYVETLSVEEQLSEEQVLEDGL